MWMHVGGALFFSERSFGLEKRQAGVVLHWHSEHARDCLTRLLLHRSHLVLFLDPQALPQRRDLFDRPVFNAVTRKENLAVERDQKEDCPDRYGKAEDGKRFVQRQQPLRPPFFVDFFAAGFVFLVAIFIDP